MSRYKQIDIIFVIILVYSLYFYDFTRISYEFAKF
jgi:hypothetical protein